MKHRIPVLFSKRIIRDSAEREWIVKLVPYNGGEILTVRGVVAFGPEAAMRTAAEANPGYIGRSARCTKVL